MRDDLQNDRRRKAGLQDGFTVHACLLGLLTQVFQILARLFKQDLQDLVNDLGVEIRVAHYPSYCSKYNPIERRFFPHITRACQGMLFDTLQTAVTQMRKASTATGLKTTVNVIHRAYELGRKVAKDFKSNMTLLFDDLLPAWNYLALPD